MYKVKTPLSSFKFDTLEKARDYQKFMKERGFRTKCYKPFKIKFKLSTLALLIIAGVMLWGVCNWERIIDKAMYYNEYYEKELSK